MTPLSTSIEPATSTAKEVTTNETEISNENTAVPVSEITTTDDDDHWDEASVWSMTTSTGSVLKVKVPSEQYPRASKTKTKTATSSVNHTMVEKSSSPKRTTPVVKERSKASLDSYVGVVTVQIDEQYLVKHKSAKADSANIVKEAVDKATSNRHAAAAATATATAKTKPSASALLKVEKKDLMEKVDDKPVANKEEQPSADLDMTSNKSTIRKDVDDQPSIKNEQPVGATKDTPKQIVAPALLKVEKKLFKEKVNDKPLAKKEEQPSADADTTSNESTIRKDLDDQQSIKNEQPGRATKETPKQIVGIDEKIEPHSNDSNGEQSAAMNESSKGVVKKEVDDEQKSQNEMPPAAVQELSNKVVDLVVNDSEQLSNKELAAGVAATTLEIPEEVLKVKTLNTIVSLVTDPSALLLPVDNLEATSTEPVDTPKSAPAVAPEQEHDHEVEPSASGESSTERKEELIPVATEQSAPVVSTKEADLEHRNTTKSSAVPDNTSNIPKDEQPPVAPTKTAPAAVVKETEDQHKNTAEDAPQNPVDITQNEALVAIAESAPEIAAGQPAKKAAKTKNSPAAATTAAEKITCDIPKDIVPITPVQKTLKFATSQTDCEYSRTKKHSENASYCFEDMVSVMTIDSAFTAADGHGHDDHHVSSNRSAADPESYGDRKVCITICETLHEFSTEQTDADDGTIKELPTTATESSGNNMVPVAPLNSAVNADQTETGDERTSIEVTDATVSEKSSGNDSKKNLSVAASDIAPADATTGQEVHQHVDSIEPAESSATKNDHVKSIVSVASASQVSVQQTDNQDANTSEPAADSESVSDTADQMKVVMSSENTPVNAAGLTENLQLSSSEPTVDPESSSRIADQAKAVATVESASEVAAEQTDSQQENNSEKSNDLNSSREITVEVEQAIIKIQSIIRYFLAKRYGQLLWREQAVRRLEDALILTMIKQPDDQDTLLRLSSALKHVLKTTDAKEQHRTLEQARVNAHRESSAIRLQAQARTMLVKNKVEDKKLMTTEPATVGEELSQGQRSTEEVELTGEMLPVDETEPTGEAKVKDDTKSAVSQFTDDLSQGKSSTEEITLIGEVPPIDEVSSTLVTELNDTTLKDSNLTEKEIIESKTAPTSNTKAKDDTKSTESHFTSEGIESKAAPADETESKDDTKSIESHFNAKEIQSKTAPADETESKDYTKPIESHFTETKETESKTALADDTESKDYTKSKDDTKSIESHFTETKEIESKTALADDTESKDDTKSTQSHSTDTKEIEAKITPTGETELKVDTKLIESHFTKTKAIETKEKKTDFLFVLTLTLIFLLLLVAGYQHPTTKVMLGTVKRDTLFTELQRQKVRSQELSSSEQE